MCTEVTCPLCRRAFCATCRRFPPHRQLAACAEAAAKRQEWGDAVVVHEASGADAEKRRAAIARRAQALCLGIIDDILTTRCPKCRRAFVDFDGCFALRCSCGCAFCGWCLQPCARDAHAHVAAQCPHGPGAGIGLVGSMAAFNTSQNRMRSAALRSLFERLPSDELRSAVAVAIESDLRDVGLCTADYHRVPPGAAPRDQPSLWDSVRSGVSAFIALPLRVTSRACEAVAPPRELPAAQAQAVPQTDAPCASCGEKAYSVRWTCACCAPPAWHVCGACVDAKGVGALCGAEGHWLFRQARPPPAAQPLGRATHWQCSACTLLNSNRRRYCAVCHTERKPR